jgi:DNA polymerase-1
MNVVAFDTETRGLDWWDPDHRAFLITWADENGSYYADENDKKAINRFKRAIAKADIVVGHNLPFDVHQVRRTFGFDPIKDKEIHDTANMSRVLFPEGQSKGAQGGHGLKNLAVHFLASDAKDPEKHIEEMGKSIGLRTIRKTNAYYLVYRAYPDVMIEYALADAQYTYELFFKFMGYLEQPDNARLKNVYDLEAQVQPILIQAEERGLATDQDAVQKLKAEYSKAREDVYEALAPILGTQALGGEGSEQALTDALLAAGVPLTKTTKDGKLSTDKFVLEEFATEYPFLDDLLEYRKLEYFLTYYIGMAEGNEVIHTSFGQIAAWTGRMSARRPNMQNLPKRAGKEVRSIIVPRPGHAFVVYDYEGIEVRLLAYYLADPGFREKVANGDPHSWMATNIWGGVEEDYAKGSVKELTHRSPAKNILFAITYGAGGPRVRNMLRSANFPSSIEDAKAIISKIKRSLPNYFRLNSRIKKKIEQVGYVNTLFGRKQIVNKDKAYVGLNALIQGGAADIMKQGIVNIWNATNHLDAVPVLFVHDEVVVEVPVENAHECAKLMEVAMCSAADIDPPLAVSGSIVTTSYADA